jgi:hypothetical protein
MRAAAICALAATAALGLGAAAPEGGARASADPGFPAAAAPPQAKKPAAGRWAPHVGAARRYAKRRAGRVSFDVIDQRRRERGFRARSTAPMASTLKVMLMTAYLRRGSVKHRRLRRSERRLLAPMIRRSDNASANRLVGILGPGPLYRLARRAGMRRFHFQPGVWGLSRSSPRDQARFMRRLDRLVPARHRAYAKRLLARIVRPQRWGIGSLRLRGWRVHFKGGWGSGTGWVDHQVALLEGRGRRISVAIFTESSPSHGYGKRTLRGVARRLLRGLPRPGAIRVQSTRVGV